MVIKSKKEIQFEQPSDLLLLANRYIMFIMAFIVIAMLFLGYFFILKPEIDAISSVESESTATEERRLKNELLVTKLEELEAEYDDIMNNRQEDLDSLKKIVPHDAQIAELFLIADRLAQKYDFQLSSIDISGAVSDQKTGSTPTTPALLPDDVADQIDLEISETPEIQLTTVDDVLASTGIKALVVHLVVSKSVVEDDDIIGEQIYDSFKDYVAEIENNMRLMDVQAVSFNEIAAEGEADYSFKLDLITYYQ
jgi:hypothetical protein